MFSVNGILSDDAGRQPASESKDLVSYVSQTAQYAAESQTKQKPKSSARSLDLRSSRKLDSRSLVMTLGKIRANQR
jgi:hypothetical protein